MNITAEADNKICVELTKDDMSELDITYDELDYSNIETRRVLWTLLDEARHKLGKNIYLTQKMLIEAVPDDKGGCSIIFTVMQEDGSCGRKKLVKLNDAKIICRTDNIDDMGAMAKILSENAKIAKSELYTDGKSYRIILYPRSPSTADLSALIGEFCDVEDETAAPYTFEHWKKLASPDALGILGALN